MKRIRSLWWLPLVVLAIVLFYNARIKPRSVTPLVVTRGTVRVEALGTGSVESRRTIELGAELSGRITTLAVDQGDLVQAGQELLRIDDETYVADSALATEEVTLAESALARTDADIDRAEAVLTGALANLDRVRPLVESSVLADRELDEAQERHNVAIAELARANAARVEAKVALGTAGRRLQRADADLARTTVYAPFDGIVLRRLREVGDVAVPGAGVLRLAATDTIWASVWVDEIYLGDLTVGQSARIVLRSKPDEALGGTLARIGQEADRETRELVVDVAFDDPPTDLVMGQRVDLWILLEERSNVVRVPVVELSLEGGSVGAFVVEDGKARIRALELGARGGEYVEVLSGLTAGESILPRTDAQGRVTRTGDRVKLVLNNGAAR